MLNDHTPYPQIDMNKFLHALRSWVISWAIFNFPIAPHPYVTQPPCPSLNKIHWYHLSVTLDSKCHYKHLDIIGFFFKNSCEGRKNNKYVICPHFYIFYRNNLKELR